MLSNAKNIQYIGNHTANEDGDLMVDEQVVELKYTDGSLGTYLILLLNLLKHIGFMTYSEYLKTEGYYNELINMGIKVSMTNISPVSMSVSKNIRYNQPELYKLIVETEKTYRLNYVMSLYQFLMNNDEARLQFVKNIIKKEASNKNMTDRLMYLITLINGLENLINKIY